jgi:hypothetical protein
LSEYVNIIAVSALATTLFLGGYRALPGLGFTEQWLGGWFTLVWFFIKVLAFLSNSTLADTEIVKVHSIDMPQDFISDNYEKNYDEASEHYKMMLNEKLEQILGL